MTGRKRIHTINANQISKIATYFVATLWLVIILALSSAKIVSSREKLAQQELDRFFCQMEKETVKEVRNILGSQGYINSGVTLTRITEAEGQVEYVLNIHHERLYQIDNEERQELVEKLDDISAKRGYTFLINFYEIEEV